MKILFVYTSLPKGGIETFFVRMAKELFNDGYEIRFLFFGNVFDDELIKELEKFAIIFNINKYLIAPNIYKKQTPLLKLLIPIKKEKLHRDVLEGITHIHAPDYNSLLYTGKILPIKSEIKVTTGVYHINEYNFSSSSIWYFKNKIEKLLKNFPWQNILFFNEISKEFYNEKFADNFKKSVVTPIGINFTHENSMLLGEQNNKIVSIGRLTQWKKYNFHMLDVIKSLQNKNIFFYYDSYGSGSELTLLNNKVKDLELQDYVTFHGNIPYTKFKETISKKLMFIGGGTALIEASALGIPSLIGIENEEEPLSYGFLHNTSTYSYQEKQLKFDKKNIEYFILYLKGLSEESYKSECEKARLRAKDFSIDKTKIDFINMINSSQKFNFFLNYYQLTRIVLSMFLNKLFCPNTNYSKRL